jgi:hypothetical protein
MKKNTKVSVAAAAEKAPVEYDGYYLIDTVSRSGHRSTIPARGYNLRSWLNFEHSLNSTTEYRAVTEKEYMKYFWSGTPYVEDEPAPKKPAKTAVKKAAKKSAKSAAKKSPAAKKSTKRANT